MDYRTDNFLSPAAAAAAVAAHQPYHYLNQPSNPYSYNPYSSGSYVNGVSGTGSSSSSPSNPSIFSTSPVTQYSSSSTSPFSTGLPRYAGKFSNGLSRLTPTGSNVSALYPGSGLASLVASGTSYTGSKDFTEDLLTNPTPPTQFSLRTGETHKNSIEDVVKRGENRTEKLAEKCRASPGLSVDSINSSTAEGKDRNDLEGSPTT